MHVATASRFPEKKNTVYSLPGCSEYLSSKSCATQPEICVMESVIDATKQLSFIFCIPVGRNSRLHELTYFIRRKLQFTSCGMQNFVAKATDYTRRPASLPCDQRYDKRKKQIFPNGIK